MDLLIELKSGKNNHSDFGEKLTNLTQHIESGESGHPEVEKNDICGGPAEHPESGVAIAGCSDDHHLRMLLQHRIEPRAYHRMIVDKKDADPMIVLRPWHLCVVLSPNREPRGGPYLAFFWRDVGDED